MSTIGPNNSGNVNGINQASAISSTVAARNATGLNLVSAKSGASVAQTCNPKHMAVMAGMNLITGLPVYPKVA